MSYGGGRTNSFGLIRQNERESSSTLSIFPQSAANPNGSIAHSKDGKLSGDVCVVRSAWIILTVNTVAYVIVSVRKIVQSVR